MVKFFDNIWLGLTADGRKLDLRSPLGSKMLKESDSGFTFWMANHMRLIGKEAESHVPSKIKVNPVVTLLSIPSLIHESYPGP